VQPELLEIQAALELQEPEPPDLLVLQEIQVLPAIPGLLELLELEPLELPAIPVLQAIQATLGLPGLLGREPLAQPGLPETQVVPATLGLQVRPELPVQLGKLGQPGLQELSLQGHFCLM